MSGFSEPLLAVQGFIFPASPQGKSSPEENPHIPDHIRLTANFQIPMAYVVRVMRSWGVKPHYGVCEGCFTYGSSGVNFGFRLHFGFYFASKICNDLSVPNFIYSRYSMIKFAIAS